MHKNQTEYDKKQRERKQAQGLVQVKVWVPEQDREKLKQYAQKLREGK